MTFEIRTTARDRWLDRGRWWRYTFPFQLAHGPLCKRHRRDVLRLGRVWLCRSCALLYGAALAAGILGVVLRLGPSATLWVLAAPVVLLSFPPLYRSLPRLARDALRAGAGVLIGRAVAWILLGSWGPGLLVLLGFGLLLLLYRPFRRRQRDALCAGCPELEVDRICSGYRRQAVRLRRYEEAAARALDSRLRDAVP